MPRLRSPRFWEREGGLAAARLLQPLALATRLGASARIRLARPWRAPVPTFCVGNLVAGGAGKTPVALALLPLLRERYGDGVHILVRGYGGRERGPLRVRPDIHDAAGVGDEALLLACAAPAWVARDRRAGAAAAVEAGARALLLDDGFQDPSIVKDLSILVVDGGFGFGNGRLIPAGPLREPVTRGLDRAHAVAIVGPDTYGIAAAVGSRLPVFRAAVHPGPEVAALPSARLLAFAGIGRPAKFFDMLEGCGLHLVAKQAFADHHRYRPDEVMRLCEAASAQRAVPVTTDKDHVRLPPEARAMVRPISMSLVWDDPEALRALLYSRLP